MSVQALSWALDFSEAGGSDRLVIFSLAHHADQDGFVGLSKATIARETRLSETTVWRSLGALEQLQEIQRATEQIAPRWWHAIRNDRRPILWRMSAYLANRTVVQTETPSYSSASRGRDGVATGSRSYATRNKNSEIETLSGRASETPSQHERRNEALRAKADKDCISCRGEGHHYSAAATTPDGAGRDIACFCTYRGELPEREESA